jgi:cbb3-type cytochrome oxidase subunit 3
MNQVLHAGAETAQLGTLLGFTTVFFAAVMVGWTVWAWTPGRRAAMEAAARLPLEGGEE